MVAITKVNGYSGYHACTNLFSVFPYHMYHKYIFSIDIKY